MIMSSTDVVSLKLHGSPYLISIPIVNKFTSIVGDYPTVLPLIMYTRNHIECASDTYIVNNMRVFKELLKLGFNSIYILRQSMTDSLDEETCKLMNVSDSKFLLISRAIPYGVTKSNIDLLELVYKDNCLYEGLPVSSELREKYVTF